ncbi:MAG: transglutaminase-like domain-containing protein [Clostridium sp.]|nr:transglutaminase-like domain-containing protein [Clostridium sp.]MCM1208783.1 transglutaminase-like domain-containing protein [Ruminococcus sp.]
MAKRKPEKQNKVLCEGIELSYDFFERKESRLKTLLLKGFIVYLISMGSIGFYLSAFDIEYNAQLCHVVIFVMAIICAMLYYRLLVENLGYLVLLLGFTGLVILFRRYINSGFYAIVNITVENASEYFNVDIQRLYQEQITNRYVTVTCVALFIGIVLDIFINVYISRRMQYVTVAFVVMFFNVVPLYLVEEPNLLYVGMLMAGITMAYIFKSGKHYSPQVNTRRNDNAFIEKGKDAKKRKSELFYVSDIKAMVQAGITAFVFVLLAVVGVNAFRPQGSFNAGYGGNKYKNVTMEAMTTILLDGWQGFFGQSYDVGGLHSGKLGDVSSIRLDYQSDLLVEITPYTYDRIYIKNFVGELYNPYQNEWTEIHGTNYQLDNVDLEPFTHGLGDKENPAADYTAANYGEYKALKEAYDEEREYSAKGIMNIRLADYGVRITCAPYYSEKIEDDSPSPYDVNSFIYYPYFAANNINIKPETYLYLDLDVPEENVEAIKETIAAAGATGTDERVIQAVINYYQENIPYTIRPGRTPDRKDFVNYFLTENKKGYCAHYATAAVLMFRYMGIPARYVEGYAIDYVQMADGELVTGAEYADYYDGYSELGDTALIRVSVTDADAHAWVEVYTAEKGWHVVDVTPSGEMEEVEDFWTLFEQYMSDDGDDNNGPDLDLTNVKIPDALVRGFFYVLLGAAGAAMLFFVIRNGGRKVAAYIRYRKSGINDKLIYKYSEFRRAYTRKHKEFGEKLNYHEQIEFIADAERKSEAPSETIIADGSIIIDILERAGFSAGEITDAEYDKVIQWLGQVQ